MKFRILSILLFAVQIGFGQIYIDSYRFASAAPTNLLLDDYPGATAAYSLRKLDKDYTGSAIQIRTTGTGTNQPAGALTNIGFDSNGDLDETAIINHCLGTSCTVQTWYDQSGNNNHSTKTSGQAIIYQSGSIITENGKPALRPVAASGYPTNVSGLTDFSIIVTGNTTSTTGSSIVRFVTTYAGTGSVFSTDILFDYFVSGFRAFTGASSVSVSAPASIDFVGILNRSGTSTNIDINNGLYQNTANLSMSPSKPLFIFEDPGVDIFTETARGLNEVIIYNTSQIANKSGIFSNINSYYSIY